MDMISYVIGLEDGKRRVELSGGITCTDDGSENVTIENAEESEET